MATITITEVIDDLRTADEITRRFERLYWLSSEDFYKLYQQGLLDDGEHVEDFALWAGYYEIAQDRQRTLELLSHQRTAQLRRQVTRGLISIAPPEPSLEVVA